MRYFIIGIWAVIFFVSCTDETTYSYSVGEDFIDSNVQLRYIDTFTVQTGTFRQDSLITSAQSRILLGRMEDPVLGELSAQSYFQMSGSYGVNSEAIYDSIGFVLYYDSYYYGDTVQPITLNLHRITETVEPVEGDFFYNTSTLDYDAAALGTVTFLPKPTTTTDSVYIPLDKAFGQEIFDKIADNEINNEDDFLQFLKGITIVPDNAVKNTILGFSADQTSSMRLYYTIEDGDIDTQVDYLSYYVSSQEKLFNNVTSDLSQTQLSEIKDVETVIASENTNNQFYVQAGTGLSARIEVNALRNLNQISKEGTSLDATLLLTPQSGTFDENKPLPETLMVFVIDKRNAIVSQLTTIEGTAVFANLVKEGGSEFEEETYYRIDLSGFLETILTATEDFDYALMLEFVDNSSAVRDLTFKNDVSLEVIYLNY